MIPKASEGLQMLAGRVLGHVVPALSSKYVMSDTAMLSLLMNALSHELESGVANRLLDIHGLTELFQQAKALGFDVPDATEFLPGEQTLSGVNEVHDAFTRALIDLHEQVERNPDYAALNDAIWRYLAVHAERHAIPL